MNYDPNLFLCGNSANQTIKLTFAAWEYRKEVVIEISSNVSGLAVVEYALEKLYDSLMPEFGLAEIILEDASGSTLSCEDEEEQQEDWLMSMLIGAEITDVVPNK